MSRIKPKERSEQVPPNNPGVFSASNASSVKRQVVLEEDKTGEPSWKEKFEELEKKMKDSEAAETSIMTESNFSPRENMEQPSVRSKIIVSERGTASDISVRPTTPLAPRSSVFDRGSRHDESSRHHGHRSSTFQRARGEQKPYQRPHDVHDRLGRSSYHGTAAHLSPRERRDERDMQQKRNDERVDGHEYDKWLAEQQEKDEDEGRDEEDRRNQERDNEYRRRRSGDRSNFQRR